MRVTEVKVFPVTDDKLKAFVSVVLDDCFMVNDIKVIEGRDGRFISMPSRRKRNGKFKDIAHPLNSDTRQMLESEILGEYDRMLNGDSAPRETAVERHRERQQAAADGDSAPEAAVHGKQATDARQAIDGKQAIDGDEPIDGKELSDGKESSLEEVTEKHLSDSFWTS